MLLLLRMADGGQAVVPAAAALHGANNHENCSCGLENDVPPPSGTKSRHPPPTQAAQRRCPAGHAAMPNQQHGRPSRLLRPWACLELKGRHGCSPRHVAGSVNEPTSAGSAVRRPCWPASAVAGGRRVGMGGCGQHFSPFGRIQSRLQQVLIGRNGTSSRRKAAHWSVDYCSPTASKRSLAAPPPSFENRSSPSSENKKSCEHLF